MNTPTKIAIHIANNGNTYIEIFRGGGAVDIKPVSVKDIVSMFQENNFTENAMYTEADVLATNSDNSIVWWRKPQIQSVKINIKNGKQRVCKVLNVPLPGLVLRLKLPKAMDLVAIKGSRRPSTKTELFYPPLPNIGNRGSVCLGSTRFSYTHSRKLQKINEIQSALIWKEFFNSAFSGHNAGDRSNTFSNDVRALLLKLEGEKKFPKDELVPLGRNLGEWLER